MNDAGKARAGLCLLYEKWFGDYCNDPANAQAGRELARHIDADGQAVVEQLARHFDLSYAGPMASAADVDKSVRIFRDDGVDLIIVVSLFWSGDKPLIRLLQELPGLPLLVWCYTPFSRLPDHMGMNDLFRACGVVGSLQTSAPLRKLGKKPAFVFGVPGDPVLDRDLGEYSRAFAARRDLRGLRLGHLGGRYEEMTGTYADEFFLLGKLGVELVPLSAHRLYDTARSLADEEIHAEMAALKKRCREVRVPDADLHYAVRASLAVGRLAREEGLGALALEDFNADMHRLLKTRPQLWAPEFDELRIVPSMEGDVLAALALWICRRLGSTPPMYAEMFAVDPSRNSVLMGHAAMNCPDLAGDNPLTLIPDAECGALDETGGAWLHFKGKSGPVLTAGLFDLGGGAYRATVFSGTAGYSELLDSSPNVLVEIPLPLREFFRLLLANGMTQHFALSYDDIGGAWEKFCGISGIDHLRIC